MSDKSSRQFWIAGVWLLIVVMISVVAIRQGGEFDSSVMALLPESEQHPLIKQAADQLGDRFSRRLILLLSGTDEDAVRHEVESLSGSISLVPGVSDVIWRMDENEVEQFREDMYPYRFSILSENTREQLLDGKYEDVKKLAVSRLISPLSPGSDVAGDPFGLFQDLLINRRTTLNVRVSNTMIKVSGTEQPTYMIVVNLSADPFSSSLQKAVMGEVDRYRERITAEGITISMSGMLMHADAGAKQARVEISSIGLGSMLGIVLAMLYVFRGYKPLVLVLLSISVGCIVATAVSVLVFDRVHLVTFAFGAGLVGVSIDYSLHYLCEKSSSGSERVLNRILPGLVLGVFSSVIAYSAQAMTPFPGLRQMAVFSVSGLIASWLTVVLLFPVLTMKDRLQALPMAVLMNVVRQAVPDLGRNIAFNIILFVLFVMAMAILWRTDTGNDVRLLQTSPESLIEQEKMVHEALGAISSSQFLLVTADNIDECLIKEERLDVALKQLEKSGLVDGYLSLSMILPSLARQAENLELVRKLYNEKLGSLYELLNISDTGSAHSASWSVVEDGSRLSVEDWLKQSGSKAWRDLVVINSEGVAATVIRFGGLNEQGRQELIALAESQQGVFYVDNIKDISDLMNAYGRQIINWLLAAYLFVILVLFLRYRMKVLRVITPLLLSSVFTLAIVAEIEGVLNLFHFMALILVLGIGLDMGVFLTETDGDSYTWLAVSLSAYTSLIAFGMLTWSTTPVLHHFGLTVLTGLLLVWLITPVMQKYMTTRAT